MINVTRQSDPCIEGFICGVNTTSSSKFDVPCPPGFWCDLETKPGHLVCAAGVTVQQDRAEIAQTMVSPDDPKCPCLETCGRTAREDNRMCYCPVGLCPAGFICNEGTRASRRTLTPCTAGFYCPEGTSPAMLPSQRCPDGTISPAQSTTIFDCVRLGFSVTTAISNIFFFLDEQQIREQFGSYIVTDDVYTCRPFEEPCVSNLAAARRLLEDDDVGKMASAPAISLKINAMDGSKPPQFLKLNGRHNYSAQVTANWHVRESAGLQDSSVGRTRRLQGTEDTSYGGLYLTPPPPQLTFRLPAFMLSRFNFDLEHVPTAMRYDDHYRIAIFIDGHKHSTPYPASFWFDPPTSGERAAYPEYKPHRWSKSTQIGMHLHGMRDVLFRIELQILHGLYTEQVGLFEKAMQLQFLPEAGVMRSHPGKANLDGALEMYTFMAAFEKAGKFALPLNMPRLVPADTHYGDFLSHFKYDVPTAILEYARSNMSSGILLDPLEGEMSVLHTADDYWVSSLTLAPLSHLPFFSHCTGGVQIGMPPSGVVGERNYATDSATPFAIGHTDALGGSPVRQRNSRILCNCDNTYTYEDICPPDGRPQCIPVIDRYSLTGEALKEMGITTVELSGLPTASNKYHYLPTLDLPDDPGVPDFRVSSQCLACPAAGYAIGDAYPALHKDALGKVKRIAGWVCGHGPSQSSILVLNSWTFPIMYVVFHDL